MTHAVVAELPTDAAPSTSPSTSPDAAPAPGRDTLSDREWLLAGLPVASVVVACAWWLIIATRWFGGRAPGAIGGGAILTGLAVALVQPHRFLPRRAIVLAVAVSVGAYVVALTSATGWAGAGTASTYVAMSWTVIAVAAAVVRDGRVAGVLVSLIIASAGIEMAESWLAWWGGESPLHPITGTFYWYNQFAVFLVAGGVLGLAVWLQRTGLVAVFGLFVSAIATIGIVYSTSRAVGACYAMAAFVVIAVHTVFQRWSGLRRSEIWAAVTAIAVWGIAGPPFFPHRASPFAGTQLRSTGQTLGQNGSYRVDFWREAIGVFSRNPVVGGGFHSMDSEAVGHNPHHWVLSPFAHNGYLQALTDGGLVLGVPFLLAMAGIAWLVVASLVRAVRRHDMSVTGFVLPLVLGALLAHSAVDFDWTYAADFAVTAVLAGMVAGTYWSGSPTLPAGRTRRVTAALALAGVALTFVAGWAGWSGDMKEILPLHGSTSASGHSHP